MEPSDYIVKMFYNFQHKYFNTMLSICKQAIAKYSAESCFKLYHPLALILINRLEEGIHELEELTNESEIKLASTIALMYGHKLLGVGNKELFLHLDSQVKEYKKTSTANEFYYAAFVLVLLNKLEKALDYIEKAVILENKTEYMALKGWICLLMKAKGKNIKIQIKPIFSDILHKDPKNLLAVLGYTECCLYDQQHKEALNQLNQKVTNMNIFIFQKIKVYFASFEWDQALEIISSLNATDNDILFTLKYEILIDLCKLSGNYNESANKIKIYHDLYKKYENKNFEALLELSRLFATLSNHNELILNETVSLLETAIHYNSEEAELVVELGYQTLFLGKIQEASRLFKSSTKIDQNCFDALLGLSLCEYIENGRSEQLLKQIDYLLELKNSINSLRLRLLQAKASDNSSEALEHLHCIHRTKMDLLKFNYFSDKLLLELDPEFILDVVKEYMKHISENKKMLTNALELVETIVKFCPGSIEANCLLAKLQYFYIDDAAALKTLQKLTSLCKEIPSQAGLLMAQIHVKKGQFQRAEQTLEECISYDFGIRQNPMYHYITAMIFKDSGNFPEVVNSLKKALSLAQPTNNEISLLDKASIYTELINALNTIGQSDESAKLLEEATKALHGTSHEFIVLMLNIDNMLLKKHVQGALDVLNKITKNDIYYKDSRIKMAEILLKYRRDTYAFIQIYEDFVQDNPCADSYSTLGDAYLKILEPNSALENYEKALKENPKDSSMMLKMGKALIETHYFKRAEEFYRKSIKETNNSQLKLELVDLYINLRQYDKGESLLLIELENEFGKSFIEDSNELRYKAKLYLLLAEVQEKSGNFNFAIKSLRDAMDSLMRARKRIIVENDETNELKKDLVTTVIKLGELSISMKNNDAAVGYYKEGLTVSPNNITILMALAKLYMQMNYLELCQQTCAVILRIDAENDAASLMMADIAFRKIDFDMALFHFSQLIQKQPTNWNALIRLIEISRRMGNIEVCEEYLKVAEKHCDNASKEAGFLYCKGYFQWHSGNPNAALKIFNQIRQDLEYGTKSMYNMIEICLNLDGEIFTEYFLESEDIEYRDSRTLALKTAERLIKEINQRLESNGQDSFKCRLLTIFRLIATKEKANIEKSLEDSISLASQPQYKDNIGIILAISTAYTLLKQQQRAKNQLKRIVKNSWNFEEADYLERCWLLLADQYIQSNKLETANELITKVIQYNKSCVKALEYQGYISEKEHRFKDAIDQYEQAWTITGKNNPSLGFKLAYCLMKCKKYPDAIDIANSVLKLNPDYPNIKKDILNKCMNNLRV